MTVEFPSTDLTKGDPILGTIFNILLDAIDTTYCDTDTDEMYYH